MNRVKARQEVKEARDRITIHAINKMNGKILSVNGCHIYKMGRNSLSCVFSVEIFEAKIA